MEWRYFDDPAEFLDVAEDRFAREPVVSTVIASVTERLAKNDAAGVPWPAGVPRWFAVASDAGEIVGTAMRTAPFGAYPAYLMPMPDEAVRLLARDLLDREESLLAANGALPGARILCEEMATAHGGRVEVALHTRLFELTELIEPAPVEGHLRPATLDEIDLVATWYDAFGHDAAQQAGRATSDAAHEAPDREELHRRMADGRHFLWIDAAGTPVNLTVAKPPSYGVAAVGPVYTPGDQRGHGYASAAVAAVSGMLLAAGERPCLFTDQANPTSNKIYEAVGYRPVVDMANVVVAS